MKPSILTAAGCGTSRYGFIPRRAVPITLRGAYPLIINRGALPLLFLLTAMTSPTVASPDHSLFSAVLGEHVQDGRVAYSDLCGDQRFSDYLVQLNETDPATIQDPDERLAFWINAYNAFTLQVICDNYPLQSISELHTGGLVLGTLIKRTVWDKDLFTVNGEKISLGAIEHQIIRREFDEPRIHFAIVCAANGCPPLRNEAYTAARLDEQLTDQARIFLSDPEKNAFDLKDRTASLSPIFSWFKGDFGGRPANVLQAIAPFVDPNVAADIKENAKQWRIRYTKYDWRLNDRNQPVD